MFVASLLMLATGMCCVFQMMDEEATKRYCRMSEDGQKQAEVPASHMTPSCHIKQSLLIEHNDRFVNLFFTLLWVTLVYICVCVNI